MNAYQSKTSFNVGPMSSALGSLRHFVLVTLLASLMVNLLPAVEPNAKSDQPGAAAKAVRGPERWENTIKKFETTDAAMPPPKGVVLLIGGSNARRWTDVDDYFPKNRVINRGFGGARLTDILHFADRIVLPYAPKTILLNAGGNDLSSGKSPEQVRDTARAISAKVHATLPDTRIYHIGLPHVLRASNSPELLAAIREMNGLLAELAQTEKNFEYIDLFEAFLDDTGQPRPDLFVQDGTHFSRKGYDVLAGILRGKF
jgi:lysophospholipase L1-like esterase